MELQLPDNSRTKEYTMHLNAGAATMKPRISVLTLGVDDLERALRFYRDGLGLHSEGIVGREIEHGAVAFLPLQSGLQLALWPRASIAHDSGLEVAALRPRT